MRRNKERAPWKVIYARPLSIWWGDLRKEVKIEPLDDPLPPIMSVTDTTMTAKGASQIARMVYLLPLMLLSWFVLYISVNVLHPVSVSKLEESTNEYIQLRKVTYGSDYFDVVSDPIVLRKYERVGSDGKMSFEEYLKYREYRDGGYLYLGLKVLFFLVCLSIASYCTYLMIFFRRQADFYFDRERQIVYTWHHDKVMGCKFENLGIMENKLGLIMFMYGEFPKRGKYQHIFRYMQPTEKGYFSAEDDNSYFLALILKFMEEGKSAVITGDEFHRSKSFSLFEDNRPENFEQRLEEVLKREHKLRDVYAENEMKQAEADKKFF
ncbi:hypothetical protein RJD39_02725 [Vibrio scophthalmi]|uniref:Uncharacterized protein n=1 Tax=Vibrio scophthalmi TaxID=45658 RepID=A0A1E3WQI9_9VIBR|nr:hypothetical protein [Vibrio scophthalmi]ODS11747.1 hypothetical protein VSF3289_02014 [Vibrio scophthalmi]